MFYKGIHNGIHNGIHASRAEYMRAICPALVRGATPYLRMTHWNYTPSSVTFVVRHTPLDLSTRARLCCLFTSASGQGCICLEALMLNAACRMAAPALRLRDAVIL